MPEIWSGPGRIVAGGQDSKVIRVPLRGYVTDFTMNDKCAVGTRRFLEVMGEALEVGLRSWALLASSPGTR